MQCPSTMMSGPFGPSPLEEQGLTLGIAAHEVFHTTALLGLLPHGVAAGAEALEWATPEIGQDRLGVGHVVAHCGGGGFRLGEAHAA